MEEKNYSSPEGSCIISEEVIAKIASTAALEIPGVAGMATRPVNIRGIGDLVGAASPKSVSVINNENEMVLDVYLRLKLGARIPDVAGAVQKEVKAAVQAMTEKPVTRVNVHIMGLSLEEPAAPAAPAEE